MVYTLGDKDVGFFYVFLVFVQKGVELNLGAANVCVPGQLRS